MRHRWSFLLVVGFLPGRLVSPAAAADPKPDAAQIEFFEEQVRPLLVGQCQGCHGPDKQKGGLRLDSRAALLAGGDSGPAAVPGAPEESPIIQAVGYGDDLRMPPKARLSAEQVAALTSWVKMGVPWPEATAEARPAAATGPAFK